LVSIGDMFDFVPERLCGRDIKNSYLACAFRQFLERAVTPQGVNRAKDGVLRGRGRDDR
jgi:hypothetical protein